MILAGTITKLMHNGQKCYAVISNVDGDNFTVKFVFDGEIIEKTVPKSECRKPTMKQTDTLAFFIRQMTGVPLVKPTDTKPTKTFGTDDEGDDEPTDPMDEEQN